MNLDTQETGKHIRQYRKVAGLTQEELAQKVGISTMSIRRYESGERVATRDMLETIAATLGCDPYSLYSWDQATEALKDQMNAPQRRVNTAMKQLTPEGQSKVADYAEDILPRYQAQPTPQPPTAPEEGKDITPPPDGSEGPQEGE